LLFGYRTTKRGEKKKKKKRVKTTDLTLKYHYLKTVFLDPQLINVQIALSAAVISKQVAPY